MQTSAIIRIEKALWDEFGIKYPKQRSQIIRDFVQYLVNKDEDEESQLILKLKENQKDGEYLKYQLEKVKKNKKERAEDEAVYEPLIDNIRYIEYRQGCVGKNMVESIAKNNEVDYNILLAKCEEEGIKLEDYSMMVQEGKMKVNLH